MVIFEKIDSNFIELRLGEVKVLVGNTKVYFIGGSVVDKRKLNCFSFTDEYEKPDQLYIYASDFVVGDHTEVWKNKLVTKFFVKD